MRRPTIAAASSATSRFGPRRAPRVIPVHRERARHPPARRRQALRPDHRRRRSRPRSAGGHMRRPARPERRRQVHDHAHAHGPGDRRRGRHRRARLRAARRVEGRARRVRRRATARQPRHHVDGRAEPAGLRPPVPRPARRAPGGDRPGRRHRQPRRPARHEGRPALRGHAPAPADRPCARAPPAAAPARRADRRPRPAGAPGAVGAHRRPALGGRLDPDVHALHRGGPAPRRHRRDHVPRQSGRRGGARGSGRAARRQGGGRGLRAARPARRGRGARTRPRAAHAPHRHERVDPRPQRGRGAGRRAPAREPRGRVRAAHRRGGRVVATEAIPAAAPRRRRRLHRFERSALEGVLVREVINFSAYWRSSTFSSIVQPLIYLLAFGFGFGSLVNNVGGRDYVEFVATGTVATAVLFSSVFPAMFGTFVKYKFQRTYDAILAAPVDTEELVTAESLWIAARAGVYGCMPVIVGIFFGLNPSWGMLTIPFIGFIAGLGWACFGILIAAVLKSIDDFSYVQSTIITPLFLVAGTFFPLYGLPGWVGIAANINPLFHCVELVHHACFGFKPVDLGHLAFLVAFAVVMWRLAIHYMARRVID